MTVELRDLTPEERISVQQRFEALAGKRFAPSPGRPRHEVWWPKAPLDGRAFPGDIHPAEDDTTFNEAARLLGFMNGICSSEFFIANLSAPKPYFRHGGKFDEELCRWIKTRLVSNPTCVLASTVDVFLIIDSQLRYSVIGGGSETISKFEKRFGGAEAVQQTFTRYVEQLRLGSGHEDTKWAQDYLQKWSGWI
jgi:hypothetical protein